MPLETVHISESFQVLILLLWIFQKCIKRICHIHLNTPLWESYSIIFFLFPLLVRRVTYAGITGAIWFINLLIMLCWLPYAQNCSCRSIREFHIFADHMADRLHYYYLCRAHMKYVEFVKECVYCKLFPVLNYLTI